MEIDLSQEVRILNVTTELLESAVNGAICQFYTNDNAVVSEVQPRDQIAQKYFYVLLLELFHTNNISTRFVPAASKEDSLLTLIRRVTDNPLLSGRTQNVTRLSERSQQFLDWLNCEFSHELYSAKVGKVLPIKMRRADALYLIGNRCKHALTRSNSITRKLVQAYRSSGTVISEDEEVLVLEDIDSWFLANFGGYHFTKICELCSNLYHAIIEYVRPEHVSRGKRGPDGVVRSYDPPSSLTGSAHRVEFHDLLQKVGTPRLPIIETTSYLTLRY